MKDLKTKKNGFEAKHKKRISIDDKNKARKMRKEHPFWGCYVISFQLAIEENVFISHMSVWRLLYPKPKSKKACRFYEMARPHSMWHGDIMIGRRLPSGDFVYQLSWQDDYSRAYVSSLISTAKNSLIVINGLIEAILKYGVIPTLVHYDNGSEGKCKIVQSFCENLGINLIHSTVNQPNTNGKKERAHRDDKRDFWKKISSNGVDYIQKRNNEYVEWRNNSKGHWALKGKPSITRLNENKKPIVAYTRGYLEGLAEAKLDGRIVKSGGLVVYKGEAYWTKKSLNGQSIEIWQTLKGLEIRKDGITYSIIDDYWEKMSKKV